MKYSLPFDLERMVLISLLPSIDNEQRLVLGSSSIDTPLLYASMEKSLLDSALTTQAINRLRHAAATLSNRLASGTDIHAVFLTERRYPALLSEIQDPPFMLLYTGILPDEAIYKPCLAIVGTRSMHTQSAVAAFKFALEAAKAGCTIVSGFAHGIDQAAHIGAMDAGGITLAVLGSGHDNIFPHDIKLQHRILDCGGCFISEFLPDDLALGWHFPLRNRIISGLSTTILLVEASLRSGAMSTADHALRQGRDVVIHTQSLEIPSSSGTRKLFEDGAFSLSSYAALCSIDQHFPAGPSAVELDNTQLSHGQRLIMERNNLIIRFRNTWFYLTDSCRIEKIKNIESPSINIPYQDLCTVSFPIGMEGPEGL